MRRIKPILLAIAFCLVGAVTASAQCPNCRPAAPRFAPPRQIMVPQIQMVPHKLGGYDQRQVWAPRPLAGLWQGLFRVRPVYTPRYVPVQK